MKKQNKKNNKKSNPNKKNTYKRKQEESKDLASRKTDDSRQIINIAYTMIGLFVLVIVYYSLFMFTKSEDVINNSYNKRQDLLAEQIVRGSIKSSDGKTLANTVEKDDGNEERIYPYGDLFAHVVGRFSKGRTGIELSENFRLLTSNTNGLKKIFMDVTGQKNLGDTVITTLDYDLQKAAYNGLANNKGAIIVMEPSSGKILAMVSKPTYDPNNIDNIWDDIKDDNDNKALINRAISEAYPPGSAFKIATVLEYIRENPNYNNYSYECDGTYVGKSAKITCGKAHGTVGLKESLAVSCNTSLANIGASLSAEKFKNTLISLKLDSYLSEDLDYNHPHTAIGQGDVKVTPMQMAELTTAIANGGVLMTPYIVDHIENSDGLNVKKITPEISGRLLETWEAEVLTEYMSEVINSGTAKSLKNDLYSVAGKTGTAENKSDNKAHSWFVGFANADKPEIAIVIIVENAGSSSKNAVPIAKDIFDVYFAK